MHRGHRERHAGKFSRRMAPFSGSHQNSVVKLSPFGREKSKHEPVTAAPSLRAGGASSAGASG